MHIHWFNPENDLALASGAAVYTPPKAARQIHEAGAVLPLWYGAPGDMVLCYGVNAAWYDRVASDFGLEVDVFDHEPSAQTAADPWGWSAYTRRFFINEGFSPARLPSEEQIQAMRSLSHRRTAAEVARRLREALPGLPLTAPATEITDISTLQEMLRQDTTLMLKAPWSSSGRGVVNVAATGPEKALKMAQDAIAHQGSVMAEPAHDKILDFARLFECDGSECFDLGTSVFTTDAHGAYTGNLLADEPTRLSVVGKHFPLDMLDTVCRTLREILARTIAPHYHGILGVDMLVCADGSLDPVVEINLRKTMGYVANRFSSMHLAPGAEGRFSVIPLARETAPAEDYTTDQGRLRSGTLHLVPANPNFAFIAQVDPAR